MRPFIIGVCEREIVEALRRVENIEVWHEAFTPMSFIEAFNAQIIPRNKEMTLILVSDTTAKENFSAMLSAYPNKIITISFESEPPRLVPHVPLPVSVNGILKQIEAVAHIDLVTTDSSGDDAIYIRGLQEEGKKDAFQFPSFIENGTDDTVPNIIASDKSDAISDVEQTRQTVEQARKKLEALLGKTSAPVPTEFYAPYTEQAQASQEHYQAPVQTQMPAPTSYQPPASNQQPIQVQTPANDVDTSDVDTSVTEARAQLAAWKKSEFVLPNAITATFWSSKGGVGKSTAAINTAIWLAEHSALKVLLVDLDIEGDVAKRLRVQTDISLTDILAARIDAVTLNEMVPTVKVGRNKAPLYVIKAPSAARHGVNASMIMSPDNYRRLLSVAKSVYQVIIFDTPAGFGSPAVRQFAIPAADKLVAIIDNELSAASQFIAELKDLTSGNDAISTAKIGIVLNQMVSSGLKESVILSTLEKIQQPGQPPFRIIARAGDSREEVVGSYQKGVHIASKDNELSAFIEKIAGFVVPNEILQIGLPTQKQVSPKQGREKGQSFLERYLPHVASALRK